MLRVDAEGTKDGDDHHLTIRLFDRFDEASGLSAMQRCTAFPASSVAMMLARGDLAGGGHETLEYLAPADELLSDLAQRGIQVETRGAEVEPA